MSVKSSGGDPNNKLPATEILKFPFQGAHEMSESGSTLDPPGPALNSSWSSPCTQLRPTRTDPVGRGSGHRKLLLNPAFLPADLCLPSSDPIFSFESEDKDTHSPTHTKTPTPSHTYANCVHTQSLHTHRPVSTPACTQTCPSHTFTLPHTHRHTDTQTNRHTDTHTHTHTHTHSAPLSVRHSQLSFRIFHSDPDCPQHNDVHCVHRRLQTQIVLPSFL